jgi:hypothetical protein
LANSGCERPAPSRSAFNRRPKLSSLICFPIPDGAFYQNPA